MPRRFLACFATLLVAGCTSVASTAAPVFDGFDYSPKRVINADESFSFTANAHVPGGTAFVEWQASSGVLSLQNGPSTTWRAVAPGAQARSGRVRVEVRVVPVGATTGGSSTGGSVFLTVDDQGRASVDGFMPNVYSDSPAATPTPGLTPAPMATPVPASTDDAAATGT